MARNKNFSIWIFNGNFLIFCMKHEGQNLNLASCFWGKSCTERFGQKGIQNWFLRFIRNWCIGFFWFYGLSCHSKGWKLDKIVLKLDFQPSRNNCLICSNENSFKVVRKCFLFHLKSSFCSQDVKIFVLTFWSCRKNDLIRKIRLISKFMTSNLTK